MSLPKSLTTVTTLSKVLALILFITLPVAGFYAGMQHEKTIDPLQGADPRTRLFVTKEECEVFTDRICVSTLCEQDPQHVSCASNPQKGWFATRQPLDSQPSTSPAPTRTITNPEHTADVELLCMENNGTWLSEHNECEGINQIQCEQMGGMFDECASACRHNPEAVYCIQICVPVCTL